MDFTNLYSSLNHIIPEISIAFFLMAIVGVDLIFYKFSYLDSIVF